MSIYTDEEAFGAIKEASRPIYVKNWEEFLKIVPEFDKESGKPTEDMVMKFIKYLRLDKKCASSSLWTKYSQLNGIVKAKYSFDLGKYPRIKAQIKMFDTDVKTKAKIFDKDALDAFLGDSTLSSPYWLLRKSVTVVCFFGGLRKIECESLKLENIKSGPTGICIDHERSKQRNDKQSTK